MRTSLRRPVRSRSVRRSHPLSELSHLWRELDRWAAVPFPVAPRARLDVRATIQRDATTGAWILSAPLPGRRSDQVKVTIEDGVLQVASPSIETEDVGFTSVHAERSSRPVRLRWTLPEEAAQDSVEASLTDGWLRVEVSRKARPSPRSIPVAAG